MKILRLRLASVRGIEECEIEPARRGVTVIEGPNESGKTTLADAFEILLDKRAGSTDRTVRRLQPVGTDAGSEIEAEIATGPYRLRIFKRFNRNRETVLQVLSPAPEDLSGREAHERLQEILAETVDLDLWRALRLDQGRGFDQAQVAGSRSLLQALEGAGRSRVGGEREESLREKAQEEYQRFFTPSRGQPTGELKAALDAREASRLAVQVAADELAAVERDVERAERLRRRAAELAGRLEEARRRDAETGERLREVERLDGEVSGRRSALKDEEGRLRLLAELANAGGAEAELTGRSEAADRELRDGLAALAPLDAAAVAANAARAAALAALEEAKADERLVTLQARLAEIAAVRERSEALAQRLAAVDAQLAGQGATEKAVRDLEGKDRAVERARAALEAASAGLRLEALAPLAVEVAGEAAAARDAAGAGESVELAAGETLERRVSEPLTVTLPEHARIQIEPGRDLEALSRAAQQAERELAAGCEALGVPSYEAARAAHEERRSVEAERAEMAAEQRALTGGVEPERLTAEVAEAERAVGALLEARTGRQEPPASPGEAAERRLAAEEAVARAEAELRRASAAKAEREEKVAKARELARELAIERRHTAERVERARRGIGELIADPAEAAPLSAAALPAPAGGEAADASAEDSADGESAGGQLGLFRSDPRPALDEALADAEERAVRARRELVRARERLAALEPKAVRRAVDESRARLTRARREQAAVEEELAEVRGRLEALGERGLFDREAEALSEKAAAERRARALETRATAARTLHQALEAAREAARDAYSEPLRQAIEETGRPLFGDGFAVELDDELRIARRTLDGMTLELDRLSAGAQEQLSLIARLACARLAAVGGGVPLILDDALGHTDRERLAAFGQVLEQVADDVQVIVLTSEPERFRAVASAQILSVG